MKPVEVTWYDAYDLSAWYSSDELARLAPTGTKRGALVKTRGWLVFEDELKVVVARDWQPEVDEPGEESMAAVMVIPKGMVEEIIIEEKNAGTGN